MAFLTARKALHTNTAESIAELTGGDFRPFHDAKDLKTALIAASNDLPNYCVLSFRPVDPTLGLHVLHVVIKKRSQFCVKSRSQYWVDDAQP